MFHFIREVPAARPVAGAAPDDFIRVAHDDFIFGIGVREYPAFINQVIMPFGGPPFHSVAPPCMVLGELHQTEVGKVVGVHINQAYFQFGHLLNAPRTDSLTGCRF